MVGVFVLFIVDGFVDEIDLVGGGGGGLIIFMVFIDILVNYMGVFG